MFQHKRPRLHPRPEGNSRANTLRLLPQPEEPSVQQLALKAPIRLDPRDVRNCLKQRASRRELEILLLFPSRELENLLLFPLWELAILLLLPMWELEVLLFFPL